MTDEPVQVEGWEFYRRGSMIDVRARPGGQFAAPNARAAEHELAAMEQTARDLERGYLRSRGADAAAQDFAETLRGVLARHAEAQDALTSLFPRLPRGESEEARSVREVLARHPKYASREENV